MLEYHDALMHQTVSVSSALGSSVTVSSEGASGAAGSNRAASTLSMSAPRLQSASQGLIMSPPQQPGPTAYSDTATAADTARDAAATPFDYLYHFEQGYNAKHVILCVAPAREKIVFTPGPQRWVEWLTSLGFSPSPIRDSCLEILSQYLQGLPPGLGLVDSPGQVQITWKGHPLYFVQNWKPRQRPARG